MNTVPPACLPLAQWLHSAVLGSRPPAAHQTLSEELLSRHLVSGSVNARDVLPQVQEFALRVFSVRFLTAVQPYTVQRAQTRLSAP